MNTHIDLIVPGLCGPIPEVHQSQLSSNLLLFMSQLSKADKLQADLKTTSYLPYAEQLCAVMGFEAKPIPNAKLTLKAYGIDSANAYWMHADPVHLMADVDHAVLYDSNSLNLLKEEADVLIASLNNHFSTDGLEFIVADANHWFVKSDKPFKVNTVQLNDAVMQNIHQLMPKGEGSTLLKQIMNESQMLLYGNAVNDKRENQGLLSVNSLWFWGEGELDKKPVSPIKKCFGDNVLLKGLSQYFRVDCEPFKTDKDQLTQLSVNNKNLIVIDDLLAACSYGDNVNWLTTFDVIYEKYLSPIIKHSNNKNINVHCYPCNGHRYVLKKSNKFRFWRKGKIEEYFCVNG